MALVVDPPFESHSFSLWVFGVFDAYSFFYLALQFAVEGYERRRNVVWRRSPAEEPERFGASHVGGGAADPVTGSEGHDGWALGADLTSEFPEERWDDITYGLKMPAFYSHAARALLRDVVQLFERYLYCRMREGDGEAIPREADRTPSWFAMCERVREVTHIDLARDEELKTLRDIRHSLAHRSLGPENDWTYDAHVEEQLRPSSLLRWCDVLEAHAVSIENSLAA